jgi:DNA-binding PadR family transcriptional regulator
MNEHDEDLRNGLFARFHHERGDMPWGRGGLRGGFGPPRRGPNRARRGDIQVAILNLLSEQSMHGYQVIQELSARSGGAWTPGAGSVYPTLQAMEEQELVASEQIGSKRVYSLTQSGKALAETSEEQAPWDQIAESSEHMLELRQAMGALGMTVMQLEQAASEGQIAKTVSIIDGARKAIYLMLASDSPDATPPRSRS